LQAKCGQRAASLDAARRALDQVESRYRSTIAVLRQQLHRAEKQLRSVLTLVSELRDELAQCLRAVARIPGIEADRAEIVGATCLSSTPILSTRKGKSPSLGPISCPAASSISGRRVRPAAPWPHQAANPDREKRKAP
jgi:hypothetical protein